MPSSSLSLFLNSNWMTPAASKGLNTETDKIYFESLFEGDKI